jgi:hypothetical protein
MCYRDQLRKNLLCLSLMKLKICLGNVEEVFCFFLLKYFLLISTVSYLSWIEILDTVGIFQSCSFEVHFLGSR